MSFFNKFLNAVVKASASSKKKSAPKKTKTQISSSSKEVLEQNKDRYSLLNNNFKATSQEDLLNRIKYLKIEQRELESTLKRHSQIINESLRIIRNTKNIETIESRYIDIIHNYNMSLDYKKLGYSVNLQENFLQDFNDEFNRNIYRVAKIKVKEFSLKIKSLKTDKAKDNATKKIFTFIQEVDILLRDSKNKNEALASIQKLKDKIEDIYS